MFIIVVGSWFHLFFQTIFFYNNFCSLVFLCLLHSRVNIQGSPSIVLQSHLRLCYTWWNLSKLYCISNGISQILPHSWWNFTKLYHMTFHNLPMCIFTIIFLDIVFLGFHISIWNKTIFLLISFTCQWGTGNTHKISIYNLLLTMYWYIIYLKM